MELTENIKKNAAGLEALLFIYGEPLAVSKARAILKLNEEEFRAASDCFSEQLKDSGRGLTLLLVDDKIQLGTKAEFSALLEQVIKEETRESLTPAALETLSLIAYGGPMPRSAIDYIRGVNSSFILRNLLVRGLVERAVDPKKSNVYLYQASFAFLKHMNLPAGQADLPDGQAGLSGAEALPDYQKHRDFLKQMIQ